jgi:hypothetical protein
VPPTPPPPPPAHVRDYAPYVRHPQRPDLTSFQPGQAAEAGNLPNRTCKVGPRDTTSHVPFGIANGTCTVGPASLSPYTRDPTDSAGSRFANPDSPVHVPFAIPNRTCKAVSRDTTLHVLFRRSPVSAACPGKNTSCDARGSWCSPPSHVLFGGQNMSSGRGWRAQRSVSFTWSPTSPTCPRGGCAIVDRCSVSLTYVSHITIFFYFLVIANKRSP